MACSSRFDESFWKSFKLHNGQSLPPIGIGTATIKDPDLIKIAVDTALGAGYRSFDTAAMYKNEKYIGEALASYLPKYGLTRDDVHVTSKLSNADHGSKKRVLDAFARTEANLGFSPNLYLINFPGSANLTPTDQRNKIQRHIAWGALIELYDSGWVDSIGVSNFTIQHLKALHKEYHSDIPVVNQVEWHPLYHDESLLRYCNEQSIQLQGYHTLGGIENKEKLLLNTQIKEIADDHSAYAPQVLLTWSLQRNIAVIPKSTNPHHIKQNISLDFKLNDQEMRLLDKFTDKQQKFAWDSKNVF